MIYVLFGENYHDINTFINNLGIDNKISFLFNEVEISDIVNECNYTDLFSSDKLVIVKDVDFSKLDSDIFLKYLDNQNSSTTLVLITGKIDQRLKIIKTLKEKCTFKEFKNLEEKDFSSIISNYFKEKGLTIESKAIYEIASRVNPYSIYNELDKLYLYKINEKKVTINDVKDVTTKYTSDKLIFDLTDAVIKRDKAKCFIIYKELLANKEEPIVIMSLIANQFRLILNTKILSSEGKSNSEISAFLKEHPYRVEIALKASYEIKEKDLIRYFDSLANLDYLVKKGDLESNRSLEEFFLEL